MRNINIIKIANVLTVFVLLAMMALPFVAGAQFRTPDPGSTGVPGDTTITQLLMRIIQILLAIAGLIAVVFLIVGGFRYITAGGNEESAESGKKTIINAIIGVVVIILSFVIVRVISNALIRGSSEV